MATYIYTYLHTHAEKINKSAFGIFVQELSTVFWKIVKTFSLKFFAEIVTPNFE